MRGLHQEVYIKRSSQFHIAALVTDCTYDPDLLIATVTGIAISRKLPKTESSHVHNQILVIA